MKFRCTKKGTKNFFKRLSPTLERFNHLQNNIAIWAHIYFVFWLFHVNLTPEKKFVAPVKFQRMETLWMNCIRTQKVEMVPLRHFLRTCIKIWENMLHTPWSTTFKQVWCYFDFILAGFITSPISTLPLDMASMQYAHNTHFTILKSTHTNTQIRKMRSKEAHMPIQLRFFVIRVC